GITGASAALWVSDIPFNGPIAGIRVGRVDGKLIATPSLKRREQSGIDLVMAVSREAIVMVEGGAEEVSEADMVAALEFGKEFAQPALDLQEELRRTLNKTERSYDRAPAVAEDLKNKVRALVWDGIVHGYTIKEKHS